MFLNYSGCCCLFCRHSTGVVLGFWWIFRGWWGFLTSQKSTNTEFGDNRLFLLVDITNDGERVWFNGVRDNCGPGHFLSAFTWNYEQAELVSDGLGAYLSRKSSIIKNETMVKGKKNKEIWMAGWNKRTLCLIHVWW